MDERRLVDPSCIIPYEQSVAVVRCARFQVSLRVCEDAEIGETDDPELGLVGRVDLVIGVPAVATSHPKSILPKYFAPEPRDGKGHSREEGATRAGKSIRVVTVPDGWC